MQNSEAIKFLKKGGIGVLPTDTLYGIVACALNQAAVERVYKVKKRAPVKPCIILIPDLVDLGLFGIEPDMQTIDILTSLWPAPVSIVLPCTDARFEYLHRGTKTLAFRLANDEPLRELLRQTGPLIAPSANPEGLAPATTTSEAKAYFGDDVDFYENGGERAGEPSTLISIENGKVKVLRKGSVTISSSFL